MFLGAHPARNLTCKIGNIYWSISSLKHAVAVYNILKFEARMYVQHVRKHLFTRKDTCFILYQEQVTRHIIIDFNCREVTTNMTLNGTKCTMNPYTDISDY